MKGRGIFNQRQNLSKKAQNVLLRFGSYPIQNMRVIRSPVNKLIQITMEMIKQFPYDTLYHLALAIQINNKLIILEKNSAINIMSIRRLDEPKFEIMNVETPNITLNELIENTRNYMGDKFIPYSVSNNCQAFILSVLTANNVITNELKTFIMQENTNAVFHDAPIFRKVVNTITQVGERFDQVINGQGIIIHQVKY